MYACYPSLCESYFIDVFLKICLTNPSLIMIVCVYAVRWLMKV